MLAIKLAQGRVKRAAAEKKNQWKMRNTLQWRLSK
jgi:hypothetical protein